MSRDLDRIRGLVRVSAPLPLYCVVVATLAAQTLQITSPPGGTVVNPGQTLAVTVVASPASSFQSVIVIGTGPIGFSDSLPAPPYQFSVQIPASIMPGQYWLTADGILAPGQGADSDPVTLLVERPDNPVSMTAQPGALDLQFAGDQCGLLVFGTFPDGTSTDVTNSSHISYQSDTPSVATVDGDGNVTAVAPGSANITATYAGVSTTIPVTVEPPVAIVPAVASLYISQTEQFTAQINMDPSVNQTVTWSLSPQIGTIDQTGLYAAPASLFAWQAVTITATSVADPTKSASAQIWIFPPVSIAVTPSTVTLRAAQSQVFTAPVGNGSLDVNWSVAPAGVGSLQTGTAPDPNNSFLSVASATYYAPSPISSQQTVTLTATSVYDNSKVASVLITLVPSVAVSVSPASATPNALQSQQFTAAITYSPASSVTWSISPNIGTIDATGLYTAPATVPYQQTITITATGPDIGAGPYSGTAIVTLVPQVSGSITVPSGLIATAASNSEVDLSWTGSTEAGGTIAGYNIYHNNVWAGSTSGTAYADLGLTASTMYTYTVAAYDTSGVTSAMSLSATSSTASEIQPGLLAYYNFNEGAGTVLHDSSGNGNNGTIYSATWTPSGKTGGALSFNGASSYVLLPDANLSTAVTLEAWVNPSSTVVAPVLVEHAANVYDVFGLFDEGYGGPTATMTTCGGYCYVSVNGPFVPMTLNTWSHLAMTYDGATVQLFVNGVQLASKPQAGTIDNMSQPMYLGGDPIAYGYLNGAIDEVRIYSRALSQAEIQNDMAGTTNVSISLSPLTLSLSPVQTQQFIATVAGSSNTAVNWSVGLGAGAPAGAQPGIISPMGLYTPPSPVIAQYTVTVTAQSQADPTKTASAVVTLVPGQPAVAPTFSPVGGTYSAAQPVTLSSTTTGATIRYTTDGSTPSETAGTVYTGPFTVSGTTTVKAIAYASGLSDSSVAAAVYTITAVAPTFSPAGGTYSAAQTVTLSSTTTGATIRYTTDGSTPSETAGTVYTGPFTVSGTTTVKAIAYASGLSDSSVATAVYTITAVAPTFSPAGGTYSAAQTVTLSTTTSGATIRYTTDGSTPSETAGTVYTGPFTVSGTTTVKAIAYASGLSDSSVATAVYTITAVAPTFSPAGGTYSAAQTVTLTSTTTGATIRYTTDGSTPSETAGTVYTGPFTVSGTTTVKAIAYASGLSDSSVAAAVYTITAVAPTFSPTGGTYSAAQTVTLSSTTTGATIRYTTDGSTPSETAGTVYTGPSTVSGTTTVKAIAYASGLSDSSVATAVYTITAVAPTFSPAGGTYSAAQTVTLSSTTTGATIRYTTDGSTPSETAGTVYTGPFTVSGTTTVKAIAYASGLSDSSVATAVYTIRAVAPTFSPAGGTYSAAQTVTLSSTTTGATIRYTTDGSTPSETAGTVYTVPFTVSGTTTVKAIAYASGLSDSSVATAVYTIRAVAPTFSPAGGTYSAAQTVTLSSTTTGATIRYTTDGSTPSETAGTVYTGPFTVSGTTTVKAIAYASGLSDSSVATAVYTITAVAPTFSPAGGTYSAAQTVTLSTTTSGATIRYTTDGSTPSETAGTVYTVPFTVSGTTTVKAIAYASGLSDSSVATAVYTITAVAPTFSPAGGTYSAAQTVTLSTTTAGATIRYTTDGSTPSETAGTIYTGPFTVSGTTTVKAIAYASGLSDSSVATAVYTITAVAPTFSPAGGTYSAAQTVTLSTTTAGATIRYTTDGSTPSETAGTVYTGPFTVSGTTTVKAIAYASGLTDSSVSTAIYTIQ